MSVLELKMTIVMDAFIFNYDLCQPVNMRVCIIGDWEWSVFLFSFSVGDNRFRFLPFFEGRRHDRQCMIAIKNPVCAPLTPVIVSFSWATPYPAFPGALSKPHCGDSLNRGLIRGEYETDIVKSKGGGKMGKAQRFPTPFHDPG